MDRSWTLYKDTTWDYSELSPREILRLEALCALLPAEVTSALDAGCGEGRLGRLLLERKSLRLISLDIVPRAAESAPGDRLAGSVASLPLASASVETVIASEVLEHLPEPVYQAALDEFARVTQRFLLISVPCRELLDARHITCSACGCRYNKDWHLRRFDLPDLERLHPDFILIETSRISPRSPWQRLFNRTRTTTSGASPDSPCPLCGAEAKANYADKFRALLLEGVDSLTRLEAHKPTWLVALYQKKARR